MPNITKEGDNGMKGMYREWIGALLMGLAIVIFIYVVSQL